MKVSSEYRSCNYINWDNLPTKNGGHTTVTFIIQRQPGISKGKVQEFGGNWNLLTDAAKESLIEHFNKRRFLVEL